MQFADNLVEEPLSPVPRAKRSIHGVSREEDAFDSLEPPRDSIRRDRVAVHEAC